MNKVNYQKRMEEILRGLPEENDGGGVSQAGPVTGKKKAAPPQLLRTLQQLCAGIPVPVF